MAVVLDRTYTDKGVISAGSALYVYDDKDSKYKLLIPTTDLPATKGAPETVEKTVLTDSSVTQIEGLQSNDQKEYTFNYHRDNIRQLKKYATGVHKFMERNGMDFTGETFTGTLSLGRDAVSVNGVMQGKFFITVNSADEYPVDDVRDLTELTAIIISPLPDVNISGKNNVVLDLTVSDGATISAKAEGTGICTVSATGNKVTITGVAKGNDIVELTCSKSGEATSYRTVMVTVTD